MKQVLKYAENDEKTIDKNEKTMHVTGVNCRAETAYEEITMVQIRFDKTTGNVAYHAYQSFKTGEVYLPKNIANKVEQNPYHYQNRYMEFIHPKKKKQKSKVYKYKGKFKDISKMNGIDVLFLLLFHLLGLLPKRENYQPLSPEMKQEVRKMERYSNEIRL